MAKIPEPLQSDLSGLSTNDFIVELNYIATVQEQHRAFQGGVPEYVTLAPKLRQLGEDLGKARDAAAGRDVHKIAEKNALRKAAQRAVTLNARHIEALSLFRNDPSLLDNTGHKFKQRATTSKAVNLLEIEPGLVLRNEGPSGFVLVMVKRAKNKAAVELELNKQNPAAEGSWGSLGIHSGARVELKGQEPVTRIYVRARYCEAGQTGPWCAPVGIIVT